MSLFFFTADKFHYKKFFYIVLIFLYSSTLQANEKLKIRPNQNVLRSGERIFFKISTGREGYLYLLNLRSDGTLHLIFPNKDDSENFFEKGEIFIPTKNSVYEFRLEEDYGKEEYYIILSKKKIGKLHVRNFREGESLNQKKHWLQRITSKLKSTDWSIAETKVEVVK
ncbi:MAG: DUF4384 domain-containing protein [Leptospiraceae bacterium]|nr:DUF4384 domain-containing protein [Leptospiraceae bacterium]